MPVSLLEQTGGFRGHHHHNHNSNQKVPIHRTESTRSDKSDTSVYSSEGGSSKKVSFNNAVRVKKYSTPQQNPLEIPENKFWFKIFKTHPQKTEQTDHHISEKFEPTSLDYTDSSVTPDADVRPLSTIIESNDSLASSPPTTMLKKGHVDLRSKPRNNNSSVIRYDSDTGMHKSRSRDNSPLFVSGSAKTGGNYKGTPPEPEVDYVYVNRYSHDNREPYNSPKLENKKNKFVNGVKVMFGDSNKASSNKSDLENTDTLRKSTYRSPYRDNSVERRSPFSSTTKPKALKSEKGMEIVPKRDYIEKEVDERSDNIVPIEVWDSGPLLVSNSINVQKSSTNLPGEGRMMSSLEEGSNVWKHKTRRRYHEFVPKDKSKTIEDRPSSPVRSKSPTRKDKLAIDYNRVTDDDKLVSATDLDTVFLEKKSATKSADETDYFSYLDSYAPKMEDKATQCNLKKELQKQRKEGSLLEDANYRVIKSSKDGSVTAFSDVPILRNNGIKTTKELANGDVIYSQVDKTKKKNYNGTKDHYGVSFRPTSPGYESEEYVYASNPTKYSFGSTPTRVATRSPSPSTRLVDRSLSPVGSRMTTSTKGFGFKMSSGVDGPDVRMPARPIRSTTPKESPLDPPDDWYAVPSQFSDNKYHKDVKKETIEETMSISNSSSDDMMHDRHTDSEDMRAPKSVVREIDHRKKEISYENFSPTMQRRNPSRSPYEGATVNGGGLWFKPLDEDYRKGMVQSEVSYPAGNEPISTSYSTMSRLEKKKVPKSDLMPSSRHAFTLDRRHMDKSKRDEKRHVYKSSMSEHVDSGSERYSIPFNKKFSSTRDLTSDSSEYRRGGLAAAYKARQKRASSLNRVSGNSERYSPSSRLQGSHLHQSGISSSDSDNAHRRHHHRSNQYLHQNDPVVLYIPAVSHQNIKAEDDDRLSGLSRSQSILSSSKKSLNKSKKSKSGSKNYELTNRLNGGITTNPSGIEDEDEIIELRDEKKDKKNSKQSKELKRRHSMPKDAKFPWLQKLKMKVKARDP